MSRSKWKLPITIFAKKNEKVLARNCQIPASAIKNSILVYTGKTFTKIKISRSKVGYKYGFFSFSKQHTKKVVKKEKGKGKKKTKVKKVVKKNAKK